MLASGGWAWLWLKWILSFTKCAKVTQKRQSLQPTKIERLRRAAKSADYLLLFIWYIYILYNRYICLFVICIYIYLYTYMVAPPPGPTLSHFPGYLQIVWAFPEILHPIGASHPQPTLSRLLVAPPKARFNVNLASLELKSQNWRTASHVIKRLRALHKSLQHFSLIFHSHPCKRLQHCL